MDVAHWLLTSNYEAFVEHFQRHHFEVSNPETEKLLASSHTLDNPPFKLWGSLFGRSRVTKGLIC